MRHCVIGCIAGLVMSTLAACTGIPTAQQTPEVVLASVAVETATQAVVPAPTVTLLPTLEPEPVAATELQPALEPLAQVNGVVTQTGGLIKGLAIDPPFVYLTNGPGLSILDASDPAHPRQVGQITLADTTFEDVAVAGGLAYLVGPSGLWIVDISDVAMPRLVSHSRLPANGKAVAIQDTLAYVAANGIYTNPPGQNGLFIVDVAIPASPVLVGSLVVDEDTYAVDVQDKLALLVAGGVHFVDVSDPAAPKSVGFYRPEFGMVQAVAVTGDKAYVNAFNDFSVFDITDPGAPARLGSLPVNGSDIAVADDLAFVAAGGVTVVDVSDPTAPTGIGWYWAPVTSLELSPADNLAYIVVGQSGLDVVDISNPRRQTLAGSWEIVPGGPSWDDPSITKPAGVPGRINAVTLANGHLFAVEADHGLWAFDLSDPASPQPISFKEMPGGFRQLTVLDNFLIYVAKGGLWMVDASNPAVQRLESSCCPLSAVWLDVQDHLGYLATSENGLHVFDFADPAHPVEIGVFPSDAYQIEVAARGSVAYVAEAPKSDPENRLNHLGGGLRIIDVSDPAKPQELSFVDTPGWIEDMAIVGDKIYLAEGGPGAVRVFDVSDPATPVEVQVFDADVWAMHVIIVDGDQATVPIGGNLYTFDLPAPGTAPGLSVLGQAGPGATVGDLVYVPADDQGLMVLRLPPPSEQ